MRITNKVMQNNSLNNINNNKIIQDKLSNQMATEKKIVRPSDDPIIAIRALRLRSNVSQVTQFYDKNIPDADSWMKITEDSITAVSEVLTDMVEQCTKGSSEKLTSTDRQTILDALKELKSEVYATGNADYAGRSVFTGYRTEITLKYTAPETKKYSITEQLGVKDLDTLTHVNMDKINDINNVNFNTADYNSIVEQDVEEATLCRIRLSYKQIDSDAVPTIMTYDATAADYVPFNAADKTEVVSQMSDPSPYDMMKEYEENNQAGTPEDKFILIPETGELLMTKSAYDKLVNLKDDVSTPDIDESEIRVQYNKSEWDTDDLRPEHYFACVSNPGTDDEIVYNKDYLKGVYEKQVIEYDVGLNQAIRVNTTADEVFTHNIGRDVDDLIASMQQVVDMSETVSRLEKLAEEYQDPTTTEYQVVHKQLDAANKAFTFLKEKNQELFEGSITKFQNHLNKANYATTTCGTREKKLDLINNRLMSQKTNFETLQSQNEDIDITEATIMLTGAQLTYQAALMSVGKIMQTSLMNYI